MPRMLALGATGAEVRGLQQTLNARPPSDLPPLSVDGIFGPRTQARVQEFQRRNGLQVDGIVGPATQSKLEAGGDGPSLSLDEFRALCDYAVDLLRRELGADTASALKGIDFFQRHRIRIEAMAFPAATAPVRGNALGITAGPPVFGAVAVGGGVVVLIILAFILACALIIASLQKPANPAQIGTLTQQFDQTIQKIERELQTAPIKFAVLLILMKSAVERTIQERIDDFQRQMERCKLNNPNTAKCQALANKVAQQMFHLLRQAQLTNFGDPQSLRNILLGLARSFGFLVQLISDWARCMGCKFLEFL